MIVAVDDQRGPGHQIDIEPAPRKVACQGNGIRHALRCIQAPRVDRGQRRRKLRRGRGSQVRLDDLDIGAAGTVAAHAKGQAVETVTNLQLQ